MATIVYLDVDDEITSAAARIRGSDQRRVALVLPYGSRLATSRINFRLLAREAKLHSRRLGIVAPDASTRALAASAGLPVFHSVTEYETSLEAPDDPGDGGTAAPPTTAAPAGDRAAGLRDGGRLRATRTADPDDDGTATMIIPAAAPPAAEEQSAFGSARPEIARRRALDATPTGVAPAGSAAARAEPTRHARSAASDTASLPVVRPARSGPGAGMLVGFGILALAIVVAGVAGYVFLPSATIDIAPRVDPVGPLSFDVLADPAATEVDAANGVIPASRLDIPVSTTGDFPATGKRIDAAKASGSVRFDSINTVGPVFIPAGTRISTLSAVVFATVRGITVPRAQVNGTTIQHGIADVNVRAVKEGPEGNVETGEITQVPASLSTLQVSVRNANPTKGGKRDEFPRVEQADVDAALAKLTTDLRTRFEAALESPPGLPDGATLFPETAVLGEPELGVDPQTFVGQELEAFTLEATAAGSVLAADEAPLDALVRERLTSMVKADHQLVDGSIDVHVGAAIVDGQAVRFPVSGVAQQSAALDASALEAAIRGRSRADAEAILAPFGVAHIALWPDWVSAVPTLDQRVDIHVGTAEIPQMTAPPLPTRAPTPEPTSDGSAPPSASPSASAG